MTDHSNASRSSVVPIFPQTSPSGDIDPVGIGDIAKRVGVSLSGVHRWVKECGDFPDPRWTVGRARTWDFTEVKVWLDAHHVAPLADKRRAVARAHMTAKHGDRLPAAARALGKDPERVADLRAAAAFVYRSKGSPEWAEVAAELGILPSAAFTDESNPTRVDGDLPPGGLHIETIDQFAYRWSLSRATVYRLLGEGMPSIKVGRSRRLIATEADAWVMDRAT